MNNVCDSIFCQIFWTKMSRNDIMQKQTISFKKTKEVKEKTTALEKVKLKR